MKAVIFILVLLFVATGCDVDTVQIRLEKNIFLLHREGDKKNEYCLAQEFEENSFRFFDFTEGQSAHKKLFATHNVQCANVFFLRDNMRNMFLSHMQKAINQFSKITGDIFNQLGIKTTVRRLMRFGK